MTNLTGEGIASEPRHGKGSFLRTAAPSPVGTTNALRDQSSRAPATAFHGWNA